jgi:hypothetical protein
VEIAVSSTQYPLPPRVRFRIGVSGHRGPPKFPTESEAPVRALVDRIVKIAVEQGRAAESAYRACAPQAANPGGDAADFVIVSSLAEGADRLVADAGLKAGFTLEAILPFSRAEYRRDFETEESQAAYDELLKRASAVFELDGKRDESPRAYEAAGLIMLANTDLLIVIWDGKEAAGIGGTAEIVSHAIADGIPVVWIEPNDPNTFRLSWSSSGDVPAANAYKRPAATFRPADETTLAAAMGEVLRLPARAEARHLLTRYLNTKERRWNFCPWYSLLSWAFAGRRLQRGDFHLPPAVADTRNKWQNYLTILPPDRTQRPAIENVLLPACAVADHLANYYSLVYRSTYVFNFSFAAIAVMAALGGIFIHDLAIKSDLVITELGIIVVVLITWLYGHHRQWHQHWLECRRLAESVRHLRIFAPLGTRGSTARPRRHLDGGEEDWINWYGWSLRRLLPLPDCVVTPDYLQKMRDIVLKIEIDDQIRYHEANAERMEKLDHRIHLTGQLLFGATAFLCTAFVCLVWLGTLRDVSQFTRDWVLSTVTFLTALLPTLGAALGAIRAQGDFRTLAEQSARTAERLAAIDKILAAEDLSFAQLTGRIEQLSDVLMADLREWHTIFHTRPLALPA